ERPVVARPGQAAGLAAQQDELRPPAGQALDGQVRARRVAAGSRRRCSDGEEPEPGSHHRRAGRSGANALFLVVRGAILVLLRTREILVTRREKQAEARRGAFLAAGLVAEDPPPLAPPAVGPAPRRPSATDGIGCFLVDPTRDKSLEGLPQP